MQEETVSLQCGTSTNLAIEEVEDEDATENFEQICSPQYQNLSDVEDVDPQWTLKVWMILEMMVMA